MGAEAVVHVRGESGRDHLVGAGDGEVGVCSWDGGVAVTAAG